MRWGHVFALARMLLRFFVRRVVRTGALSAVWARGLVAVGAAALLVVTSAAAVGFLEPMAQDEEVWRLLFDTTTVSLLLWALIAFLFVKLLFMHTDGLQEFSYQLPLTNRERSLAFLLYEGSMAAVLVAVGALSVSVAGLYLVGPEMIPQIIVAVIAPTALSYLVMSVAFMAATRILARSPVRRISNVLLVLAIFGAIVAYAGQMRGTMLAISDAHLEGREPGFHWQTAVAWCAERYGFGVALLGVVGVAAVLVFLVVLLTPNQPVESSRFVQVPVPAWPGRRFGPYQWSLLRSSHTIVGVVISTAVFVYLLVTPAISPLWSLSILTFGGLYQFSATAPLRGMVRGRSSPWSIYGRLVGAQATLLTGIAVPQVALFLAVHPDQAPAVATPLLGALFGVVLTTCIGIVFPSEKDNPFSIFIGLSCAAVVLVLVALGLGVLRLPPWAMYVVVSACGAALVWYAVEGIRASESRRRHASVPAGRELRGRRRVAHPDDGHGLSVVADVRGG